MGAAAMPGSGSVTKQFRCSGCVWEGQGQGQGKLGVLRKAGLHLQGELRRDVVDSVYSPSHTVPSAPTGLPAIFVAVWVSVRATLANTG